MKFNKKVIFNFLFDYFVSVIVFCSIAIFILFLYPLTVKAASDQDYFPIEQNKNGHFTDNSISAIANYFDDETNYIVVYYFDYNYRAIVFPKSTYTNDLGQLCGEKNSALTHFSFYGLGIIPTTTYQFQLINGSQVVNLQNFGGGFNYWQNLPSSNYDTSKDYISNLRIWTTNNSSKKLVIDYEEDPTYDDPDNDTYPNNFEKPNIDDYYDPGSAPGFDGSSVENAVASLYNLFKWAFSDSNGIPGLFRFLMDNTNWAIQKVINTIRDVIHELQGAIEDFVDSINGWLSDIKDQIDYIIEPFDSFAINSAWVLTNTYGIANSFESTFTTFETAFDIAEPETFTLTIHIEDIRTFYNFGCESPVVIHLDSHFAPIKAALRTFLWVLVSFGTVFVIDKGLANWLRGERNT